MANSLVLGGQNLYFCMGLGGSWYIHYAYILILYTIPNSRKKHGQEMVIPILTAKLTIYSNPIQAMSQNHLFVM